jgi:hypothetical protein
MIKTPVTGDQICEQYCLSQDQFRSLSVAERALFRMAYMADVLHIEEDPIGSNRGDDVDRFCVLAGCDIGSPWCAACITAMLLDSGANLRNLPDNPASVHGWLDWAKVTGRIIEQPVRACVGIIIESPTTGHLVQVSEVVGDQVHDISGNTNNDGSRNGYGVFRHVRPMSAYAAFVSLEGV